MTFQPTVPFGGLAGWAFLKRTLPAQQAAFDATAQARRDETYFRDRIGSIRNAEDLVSDRRLLSVALGAFGLEGDTGNRFFIRKVLEDGTTAADALSNRLADKRYRALSAAFGFGDPGGARTGRPGFADQILADWRTRRFETALGQSSNDMRLALNAEREIARIARGSGSDAAKWFTVMGNAPLRQVMERALNLPPSLGRLDVDRQLGVFRDRAQAVFGSPELAQFAAEPRTEALVRRFLLQSDVAAGTQAPGSAALQLLQSGALFRRIG